MKHRRGFTIVELLVVVVVIAILASITFVLFTKAQMQSRDSARANNVKSLGTLLDKYYDRNGIYPTGCGGPSCADASGSGGVGWYYVPGNSIISASTTTAQLSTILSQDVSKLVDPQLKSTTPIIGATYTITNTTPGYVYRGSITADPSSSSTVPFDTIALAESGTSRKCTIRYNISRGAQKPYDTSSFLLAYYAESTKTWQIYTGSHGVKPVISGGTSGFCNIVT